MGLESRSEIHRDGAAQAAPSFAALVVVPIDLASIAIDVAVLAAYLAAFVMCGTVIPMIQIAAQGAAVMINSGFIMANVAPQGMIALGQRRSHAHSHQQKHSSNCAFHIFILRPNSGFCKVETRIIAGSFVP
jgi:hypothetical protein